jgi:Ni,Fe-hydrogenase III large subunit
VFGHRLMMDCVKPGGVVPEPGAEALMALDAVLAGLPGLRRAWPGGGALSLPDALALGVPGAAGRASGRVDPGVPGAAVSTAGDLGARMTLLSQSVERDIEAARTHLANLPVGPGSGILPHANSEGLAMAHGPHGPVWHWVRLAGGTVAASFSAGPGWLHLPALEAGARGIAAAAIPAHVASFGFRPAGMDL